MDRIDFSTLSKQAENLTRLAIFTVLTSSTNLASLGAFVEAYKQLKLEKLDDSNLENACKIIASKAVYFYSIAELEYKTITRDGTYNLIFEVIQKIKENKA